MNHPSTMRWPSIHRNSPWVTFTVFNDDLIADGLVGEAANTVGTASKEIERRCQLAAILVRHVDGTKLVPQYDPVSFAKAPDENDVCIGAEQINVRGKVG